MGARVREMRGKGVGIVAETDAVTRTYAREVGTVGGGPLRSSTVRENGGELGARAEKKMARKKGSRGPTRQREGRSW